MKKKGLIAKLTSIAAAAALSLTIFAACDADKSSAKITGFVTLDINPSIELTVDELGRVASVYAANADAEILLVDMDLEGKKIENAAAEIAKTAEKMGYINENNTQVTLIALTNDEKGEDLANKVESGLIEGSKIITSVHKESTNSLDREVKRLKESNPVIYEKLTPALLRMIRVAQKYDSNLTLEGGLKMSMAELNKIIYTAHQDYQELLTQDLKDKYERIYDERAAVIQEKIDAIYSEEYAALKKIERALDKILDEIEDELDNAEISQADAEEIASILNLNGLEQLKDKNGKITLESVEKFADKTEDALDDEEEDAFEEKFEEIERILERYEFNEDDYAFSDEQIEKIFAVTKIEFLLYEQAEDYLDEIEDNLEQMKEEINLTAEQKSEIDAFKKELKQLNKLVKDQLKDDINAVKQELKQLKEDKQNIR